MDEGALLDHSPVFFSSEIEDGGTHSLYNLAVLVVVALGGAIPTGTQLRRPSTNRTGPSDADPATI